MKVDVHERVWNEDRVVAGELRSLVQAKSLQIFFRKTQGMCEN